MFVKKPCYRSNGPPGESSFIFRPEQVRGGAKSGTRALGTVRCEQCRAAGLRDDSRRALAAHPRKRLAIVIPMFIGTKQAVDDEDVGCDKRNRDSENKDGSKHKFIEFAVS